LDEFLLRGVGVIDNLNIHSWRRRSGSGWTFLASCNTEGYSSKVWSNCGHEAV